MVRANKHRPTNRLFVMLADLMKEVLTLVDYEPFPLDQHLVPNFPLPLPPPLPRFSSNANAGSAHSANGEHTTCNVANDLNGNDSRLTSSPTNATPSVEEAADMDATTAFLPDPESLCPGVAWSDGIEECVSDFRGRYLIAGRDLKPGETLFVEKGFVTVITDKQSKVLVMGHSGVFIYKSVSNLLVILIQS